MSSLPLLEVDGGLGATPRRPYGVPQNGTSGRVDNSAQKRQTVAVVFDLVVNFTTTNGPSL